MGGTYRLLSRIGERLWVGINGLALNLVGPAAIVSEAAHTRANVNFGHAESLAIVQSLDGGELIQVLLEEVRQLRQTFATLLGRDEAPCLLEGLPRGRYGDVDIFLGGLVYGCDGLFSARVDRLEGLSIYSFDKLIVDEARVAHIRLLVVWRGSR